MTSNVISQASLVPTARSGFADIVGFGLGGVQIFRNNFTTQPFFAINDFGYNQGWNIENHVRLLCDMDGNKEADIVGFGQKGVLVSFNNGDNTFTQPVELVHTDFGFNTGWRVERHVRFAADIRNVGRCDIVAFGDDGVWVSQSNGDRSFSTANLVLKEFGYFQGWKIDRHLRFLAPVTGNGLKDIVGFADDSVIVARNNGDGTFGPGKAVVNNFCFNQGWGIDNHPRFMADLMGNGWVDIIGCGDTGVYVSMNDGNGNFGRTIKVIENFGTRDGWAWYHSRFIADLRNTKRGDVIGFGDAGVYVSFNNGDGTWQQAQLVLNNFGTHQGWQYRHPRFVVDLTGDGCADIIGFGENFVFVSINDGQGGFGEPQKITHTFTFTDGKWDMEWTVRYLANLYQGSISIAVPKPVKTGGSAI